MNTFVPELLSPAGDLESLYFAIKFGADAVYLGAKNFGMRSSCDNFSKEDLEKAVNYAHSAGKKVYMTLNTFARNEEIEGIGKLAAEAKEIGMDAFIIADLGVLDTVSQSAPGVELHVSTQAGIANYAAANMAYKLGASRVVLARELSLEDIAVIRSNTPEDLELETFVHGAMCMSVSGRCLLSEYLTGRDANRGRCTQSCRWKYSLQEHSRPGKYYDIGEGDGGSFILNADDLCTLPFIDRIIDAGVSSLKIEGRAKSFYYVASVTSAYRAAVDAAINRVGMKYTCPEFAEQEITKTSHRPYSPGFYLGPDGPTQNYETSGYIRDWQLIAVVENQQDGIAKCVQRGKFVLGETLEALLPQGRTVLLTPKTIKNNEGADIESTPHAKMEFYIDVPEGEEIPPMTILRKKC